MEFFGWMSSSDAGLALGTLAGVEIVLGIVAIVLVVPLDIVPRRAAAPVRLRRAYVEEGRSPEQ